MMKEYIVNSSRLRVAISKNTKAANKTITDFLSVLKKGSSLLSKAELKFERFKGELNFEVDQFSVYAIYDESVLVDLCKLLSIEPVQIVLQEIDRGKKEKVSIDLSLIDGRIYELENLVLELIDRIEKLEKR